MMNERANRVRQYVAARILAARLDAELTQEGLGDLLNLSPATISLYENGKRTVDVGDLSELARATRQPLDYFLPPRGAAVDGEPELVALFRSASALDRDRLLDIARALLGR